MIKTQIEMHPLIYGLLRSVESNKEESLKPKELLIAINNIAFN